MQFIVRFFLTPREKRVQDQLNYQIKAVKKEIDARALQETFQSEEKYNPILGLIVYLANDSRYSHLMSMSPQKLAEYQQYCEKIATSRTEIRKLTEQMRNVRELD